jgi:hypothetical protein
MYPRTCQPPHKQQGAFNLPFLWLFQSLACSRRPCYNVPHYTGVIGEVGKPHFSLLVTRRFTLIWLWLATYQARQRARTAVSRRRR